ncbi:type VII secretion protein EccE [Nocardia caishijiensis]|uniref:Type VII secretion protein EccE n=2 Tax=Nocardia caishijiensis TaxID=184756 RepID=A0ABQ6YR32_9NOCA|nr:type VII secretion protein EccE [Nocardia caishijiensis]
MGNDTMNGRTTGAGTLPERERNQAEERDTGQPKPVSPYDTLRDPEFWLFRIFPLPAVVGVVLVAATVAWVVLVLSDSVWGAVGAGALIGLIGLVPVRGTTLAGRMATGFGRGRGRGATERLAQAPAFDVPLAEGGNCGVRWDGDLLLTMLRIDPPPDTLTLLRHGSLSTDQLLPLTEIARCLDQFDITLAGIDLVSTGARTAGTGVASYLYDRILGPLPAVAHRTLWLVLRMDPLTNAEAVDKRGGGAEGALRTAIIATRRVANRLAARDIAASVLTSAEMNSAVRQLTHGFEIDQLEETPTALTTPSRCLTHYQVGAELITPRGLADIWAVPSLSTTLTLRLRPGAPRHDQRSDHAGTVVLNAVVRFDTLVEPTEIPIRGLRDITGGHLRTLLDTLPVASLGRWSDDDGYRGTLAALTDIAVPTAGCGQLIGADERGQGIAVSLIGDGTRHLEVIGNLDLAQQVILRATALGAHAIVHTARPEAWHSMMANLNAPQVLSLAPRSAGASYHPPGPPPMPAAPYPSTTVLVFDGIEPTTHAGGATIVHVRAPHEQSGGIDADVTLIQDPAAPNRITVRTPAATATVNMVTTPEEMHYIGESLAAR